MVDMTSGQWLEYKPEVHICDKDAFYSLNDWTDIWIKVDT